MPRMPMRNYFVVAPDGTNIATETVAATAATIASESSIIHRNNVYYVIHVSDTRIGTSVTPWHNGRIAPDFAIPRYPVETPPGYPVESAQVMRAALARMPVPSPRHTAPDPRERLRPVSPPPPPEKRIGTVERGDTVEALSKHYAAGRLEYSEFETRVDAANAAKFPSVLKHLLADLPDLPPPPPPPVVQQRKGPDVRVLQFQIGIMACLFLTVLLMVLNYA